MNKKQSIGRLGIKLIIMTFVLSLILGSCKRELYNAEKIDPARKKEMLGFKNGPKIEIINFDQFKNKVNLNALGSLKQEFVNTSPTKSNLMSIRTAETYLGFKIITDSIKVIRANGHTMYVFPVVLSSKRAVSFQNLTIDESSAGTLAFVNTYTPTKKWIADYKKGHPGKFEGDVSVKYLNLNNGNASNNQSISNKKNGQSTIAVAQNCTSTTYFFEIPYPCASGQHNPWESGCELVGDESAGYALFEAVITQCTDIPEPVGGGGGGTTPNPPPDYEPCPEEPELPTVSGKKPMGNRMLVVPPPTECDSTIVDTTTTGVKNPCIKAALDLALGLGVNSKVKSLMTGTFMENKQMNLDFNAFAFNVNGPNANSDAYTQQWNQLDPYSQQISFNTNLLPNKSQEYIVSTVFHEVLHAYLGNLFAYDTDGILVIPNEHEDMVWNYLDMLTADLRTIFPSLSEPDARALSWGGLQFTSRWALLSLNQRTAIEAIQTQYSTKTSTPDITSKGSYCN